MIINFRPIVLALMFIPAAAKAQDFDLGLTAANAGDFATALREWMPLAEQGNADAQFNLGVMYDTGEGVVQDDAEAVRWYRLAAEQGYTSAQANLGVMYHNGEGVPKDHAEAARWYRMAAEKDDAPAQVLLGFMYKSSEGVLQDNVMAHMWFSLAAANGSESASIVRDTVAQSMTSADISEAQRRARACLETRYHDCG